MKEDFWEKKLSISNVIAIVGFTLLIGLGLGSSIVPLRRAAEDRFTSSKPAGELSKEDFGIYWEVYNNLQKYYVDPQKLDAEEMYNGSIKGMVEALGDSPTAFFDKEDTENYEKAKSGAYSGIGAELDYVNKSVIVVAPFEGSPAAVAGLESQDIITEVDGNKVSNKTLTEVVMEIRGKAGTEVVLTVLRPRSNYKELEIKVIRGNVSAPSMRLVEIDSDGIAVVKVSRFTDSTLAAWVQQWSTIVSDISSKYKSGQVKGLVIDLRNNPGGFFDAAIVMAADFVPRGSVISYQREKGDIDTEFPTNSEPRLEKIPLTILVNGSSASASEIFSGAMKHYKRATIVGTKTYGKGTAQIIIPISDGSSLHVTVAKWLLPDKGWISHDNPVVPDDKVELDYDYREQGGDNQLEKAKKILLQN